MEVKLCLYSFPELKWSYQSGWDKVIISIWLPDSIYNQDEQQAWLHWVTLAREYYFYVVQ
jgi:hypothetical protein